MDNDNRFPFTDKILDIPHSFLFRVSFFLALNQIYHRGRSRTAATSKMEHFVIIVNGWKPLTIITKPSILDVAAVLDPPLYHLIFLSYFFTFLVPILSLLHTEVISRRDSCQKLFWKFYKIGRKPSVPFLIRLHSVGLLYQQEAPQQVLPCEFCSTVESSLFIDICDYCKLCSKIAFSRALLKYAYCLEINLCKLLIAQIQTSNQWLCSENSKEKGITLTLGC